MGMPKEGWFVSEPNVLSAVIIVDEGRGTFKTLYKPSLNEIEDLCREFDLPWEYLYEQIFSKAHEVDSIWIDVDVFRAYYEKVINST